MLFIISVKLTELIFTSLSYTVNITSFQLQSILNPNSTLLIDGSNVLGPTKFALLLFELKISLTFILISNSYFSSVVASDTPLP